MTDERIEQDLKIAEKAMPGLVAMDEWDVGIPEDCARFIAAARTGYPEALRELQEERRDYANLEKALWSFEAKLKEARRPEDLRELQEARRDYANLKKVLWNFGAKLKEARREIAALNQQIIDMSKASFKCAVERGDEK